MKFECSDAWVLLSIIYAKKPVDKKGIVATGDYLNHAIMTSEELEGGLRRLIDAEFVIETWRRRFDLGPNGKTVAADVRQAAAATKGLALLEMLKVVENALGVVNPWD